MPLKKILFTVLFLGALAATGQSNKAIRYFEKAREERAQRQMNDALKFAEKAIQEEPGYMDALLLAADLYRKNNQVDSALAKYKKALQYQAPYYVNYFYGKLLFIDEQYGKAAAPLKAYIQSPKASAKYIVESQNLISSAAFAAKAKENPLPFAPQNLGEAVNSAQMEYFPSISADGNLLVFTHRNMDDRQNGDEDFWFTQRDSAAAPWQKSRPLRGMLNTPANEGALSITADGQTIFFAGCNRPQGVGSCDIYASFLREDGAWSEAVNLGKAVNTPMWESQPAISPDGRTLYFVRARTDKSKNMNIYYTQLNREGRWGEAQKVPGKVNTEFQDVSPFIHFDNQSLYFSSNGHPGMGDLDFFVSRRLPDGSFGEPQNLGYPINTGAQDFSLVVAPDGKTGYFSRDGDEGFGRLDLYAFELPPLAQAVKIAYVKGKVINKDTRKPLQVKLQFNALDSAGKIIEDHSARNGEFFTVLPGNEDYALNIQHPGYLFYSKSFALQTQPADEAYMLIAELIPIKKGATVKLENVFFEFDSFQLQKRSQVELNKVTEFLEKNPEVRIELAGHTDSKGDDAYNKELSAQRAQAVYKYLRAKGIAANRLEYAGYGEEKPVTTNETEAGRALNRRTEMIILGQLGDN